MTDGILEARRIAPSEAHLAYELVAMSHPGVSKAGWTRYLRGFGRGKAGQRGLVALRDGRDCIHAIFAFTVSRDLTGEATLRISELAMARLPGSVPVKALIGFADALARELDLPATLLDLESSSIRTLDGQNMAESGYTLDRVTLRGGAESRTAPAPPV